MLRDGNNVLGAGFLKERHPRLGIPLFRLEHRDEVLITELGRMSPMLDVMLEEVGPLPIDEFVQVHKPRVPFVLEGRDGIDAPVDEDAELGILEPRRYRVLRQ